MTPDPTTSRLPFALALAVFLAPILAGWPYLGQNGSITPDGIDYVNIARNMARGRGFVHSIKWHYFDRDQDEAPIVRPAWGERPPLYPSFITPLLWLGYGAKALGAVNLALVGLACVLVARTIAPLAGVGAAAASGLVVGLCPVSLFWASYPLTEPLFLLLAFTSLSLLADTGKKGLDAPPDQARAALAGLLAAAATLTRSSGLALPAAAVLWMLWRREARSALAMGLGFAIPMILWSVGMKMHRGSYGYSMQGFHAVCLNFAAEMGQSYGKAYPTPGAFLARNGGAAARLIFENFTGYMGALFSASMLSLLTPLAGFALFAGGLRSWFGLLMLFAAFNLGLSAVVWSTHEGDRFVLPSFAALAPAAIAGAAIALRSRCRLRWLPALASAACLALYAPYIGGGWNRSRNDRVAPISLNALQTARLDAVIPQGAAVGTDRPFEVNYFCDRPTGSVQLAENPRFELGAFLTRYETPFLALTPEAAAVALSGPEGTRLRELDMRDATPLPLRWFYVEGVLPQG